MSQYDQFGRARQEDIGDDPYASEEALSVSLADRAEYLTKLINKTPMTGVRRSLLMTTLKAIRLDKAAPSKLDRIEAETLGVFERPLELAQQAALASASLSRLMAHPELTEDQRATVSNALSALSVLPIFGAAAVSS